MSTNNALPLAGKRAIVTGTGKSIGRGIALAQAETGAGVAVTVCTAATGWRNSGAGTPRPA